MVDISDARAGDRGKRRGRTTVQGLQGIGAWPEEAGYPAERHWHRKPPRLAELRNFKQSHRLVTETRDNHDLIIAKENISLGMISNH